MENLQGFLSSAGFSFKKQFGQNFISDTNLLNSIVEQAGVDENTVVLEIGAGAGTLTRALAKKAKFVYAYEIDKTLEPILAQTLAGLENVEVTFQDFERVNLPELEKKIGDYVVVANLPYYITTPLIMRFLEQGEKVKSLVVMVQEEVADRLCAKENTPDYGAITANIALRADAKVIKRVSKNMFTPRPKVDSAVVKIDFRENRLPVKSAQVYKDTVHCAFLSRRKTLENNLVNYFKIDRSLAQAILQEANVPDRARGETLSPAALCNLSNVIYERIPTARK